MIPIRIPSSQQGSPCVLMHKMGGSQYAPQESAKANWVPGPVPALGLQSQANQVMVQGHQPPAPIQSEKALLRKRSDSMPAREVGEHHLRGERAELRQKRAVQVPGWGRSEWQPQREGMFFIVGMVNQGSGIN